MTGQFNFHFTSQIISFLILNLQVGTVSFQVIFWEIVARWSVKFLLLIRTKKSSYG